MKWSLVLAVVLVLEGVFRTEATTITGHQGGSVNITCSHSYASTNVKYFCKGACGDADVLIKSRPMQQEGKYFIEDNGNTFYVTISNLQKSDEGVYWCGIERVGKDTFSKVTLTVEEVENPGSGMKMPDSDEMVYLGTGLGVAVLALATVLLLFFRLRKRDVSTSAGKNDVIYSKPSIQKKSQHATGEQGADLRVNADQPEVLYSNIRSEPEIQSNDLCYSTLSFSEDPACSAASPQTEPTMYSSVKSKPAGSAG